MSKFQIILMSVFVVFIVAGVAAFALFKGSSTQTTLPTITIWGVASKQTFTQFITQINSTRSTTLNINYVQESEQTFNQDFIKALAIGQGPDAVMIPADMILANENKLVMIPYSALPQRTFLDTYVSEANLYLRSDGITALPFYVDPLVMYWNRDLFTNAGIATVGTISNPITWNTLAGYGAQLTQKDNNSNIRKSVMALGGFSNVDNAREILGTLFLQAGNPVTERASDNSVASSLGNGTYLGLNSSTAAVSFFTEFSDPTNPYYSWNSSLPDSESYFLSGNLATYFGFASEISDIRTKNPNINFDVAPLPQAPNEKNRVTYGRLYGFSLVKGSANTNAAYSVISSLTAPDALAEWQTLTYLPPVTRATIAAGTTDPDMAIFYDGALISQGWLDPDPFGTQSVWQNMVQSIVSGASTIKDAVQTASDAVDLEIKNM
jgi:ABC-type glycerol-3-phosphate transport system substrate-binding protein